MVLQRLIHNGNHFRRIRLGKFFELIELFRRSAQKDEVHILDIGGTVAYWSLMRDVWQDKKPALYRHQS